MIVVIFCAKKKYLLTGSVSPMDRSTCKVPIRIERAIARTECEFPGRKVCMHHMGMGEKLRLSNPHCLVNSCIKATKFAKCPIQLLSPETSNKHSWNTI